MISNDKPKLDAFNRRFFNLAACRDFIGYLTKKAKVIAPHTKGDVSFIYKEVSDPANVVFSYPRTIQSLKKFFLPPREKLLSFNIKSNEFKTMELTPEKRIFFGIHSYEMQAIKRLDYSFLKGNPEANYLTRRENSIFIGIDFEPDEWHFSKSVGIDVDDFDGFSLYFKKYKDGYIVYEITRDGWELLKDFKQGQKLNGEAIEFSDAQFKSKIKYHYNRLPQVFEHVYKSKVWDDVASRCVGCGTCNMLCSTCYCFDVRDEIELNATDGQRERFWDSCMVNRFAEVAGGEDFRDKLNKRTRHRLYRKFKYITDQSGMMHCVGCGRCSRYCPADINIVDIINALIDEYAEQQQKNII